MRQKIYMTLIAAILVAGAALQTLGAQDLAPVMSGTVMDEFGRPLPGALVNSENRKNQRLTGIDGSFYMIVDDGSSHIDVSFPGYRNLTVRAESVTGLELQLVPDIADRDAVIDLGYSKQRRNRLTGAVSAVTGERLEKQPTANLSQKMIGQFAGLGYTMNNTIPGQEVVNFLIRGHSSYNEQAPTILLDGVIISGVSNTEFNYITAEEIESITILKDASAASIYGLQSRGGIISIRTKRGFSGDLKVRVTVDHSFQQATRMPERINSATYVGLRNQAAFNDGLGLYNQFSELQVEKFTDGTDREHYPDNNWRKMFLKEFTTMQRAGVSVSGGNDAVKYYSNINFMHQSQPFKIAEKDDFNPTPNNMWFNFRNNVDVKINKFLSGFINISGNVKRMKNAGAANLSLYEGVFLLPPTMYGPLTPEVADADNEDKMIDRQVVTTDKISDPVYGQLNRAGYQIHQNISVVAQAGLRVDLESITRGLSLSGSMAYQTYAYTGTTTIRSYAKYMRTLDWDALDFEVKGGSRNGYLSYGKSNDYSYNINLKANLDWERSFNDHDIYAMAYVSYQKEDPQRGGNPAALLPFQRQNTGLTVSYGYRDTYFLQGDLGYSGSDQFHPDRRFTATPAVSAAWVISNEGFMPRTSALSYLKLRASYGVMANDWFGAERFLYLDDLRKSNNYEGRLGNPYIEAEKIKMFNVGLDVSLFNSISLQFDYFKSRIDNMFGYGVSEIPIYQGIDLSNYAKTNNSKMKNHGMEVSLHYLKRINTDWTVYLSGNFSFARNKILDLKEGSRGEDYAYPYREEGYRYGQQWGYVVDMSNGNGFFNTAEELAAAPTYSFGTPRLGDLVYRDLNGDGIIDDRDTAPIGLTKYPEIFYSFSAGFNYRNLDFSVMFQGTGNSTLTYTGYGSHDYMVEGIYNDIHLNAWTQERYDSGQKITAPALSLTETTNSQHSSYWNKNSSVFRLKNVEVGYTLHLKTAGRGTVEKVRFNVRGQNLLNLNWLDTKNMDPESTGYLNFQPYRVYSVGVGITF